MEKHSKADPPDTLTMYTPQVFALNSNKEM
jgi:hypothetical protein